MDFKAYRERLGLSLGECAAQLGLKSKGHLSDMENGHKDFPIRLALQVERWSGGELRAVDLVSETDRDLLGASIDRAIAATSTCPAVPA
ncbi:MAG TPA: helix-turn-helix transcriptional regulator [Caulobacteraceae bacterium]|jgi:transcriptional regulator with XRE-family HTH domain|nr:helix-turn-helix transcriptional regulator [Caulobacteraceae bacterium]